jgi:hypothetical protein
VSPDRRSGRYRRYGMRSGARSYAERLGRHIGRDAKCVIDSDMAPVGSWLGRDHMTDQVRVWLLVGSELFDKSAERQPDRPVFGR